MPLRTEKLYIVVEEDFEVVADHLVEALPCQLGDVVLGLDPAEVGADDRPAPHDVERRNADGRRAAVHAQDHRLPPALDDTQRRRLSVAWPLAFYIDAAQDSDTDGCVPSGSF